MHVLAEAWINAPELMQFAQNVTQDETNLKELQRGMRATVRTGLNVGDYHESRIRHFHHLLDRYLEE